MSVVSRALEYEALNESNNFFHNEIVILVGNGSMEKEKEFLDKCMMYLRRSMDQFNEVTTVKCYDFMID